MVTAAGVAWGATPDPEIAKAVAGISRDRIAATMERLTGFGTRANFSTSTETNGIGAARKWIHDQLAGFSPRLEVTYDTWKVKKQGARIIRDLELVNVVAVLPGTTHPEQRLIVSGHYDSLNNVRKQGVAETTEDGTPVAIDDLVDYAKSMDAPAPGASDDASGTAVVLELARVLSGHRFEKTIVFIAFAGEEIGLVGSTLYSGAAKKRGDRIEAVFNNDIVGNDVAGNGRSVNSLVHVFSEDPADSPSRQLARYVRDCAKLYVPEFEAKLIFRNDRFGRGGDHTPFNLDGFPAIRLTTPAENLGAQHTADDTFDKTNPNYAASVARVNLAAVASLASAPVAPQTMREITTGPNKGRPTTNLGRGKSNYDAVLRWREGAPAEDLAGYAIVLRTTTAAYWEREIGVGKVNQYTLQNVSVDDVVFGVKAIDKDGHESPVTPWVNAPAAPRKPIELVE